MELSWHSMHRTLPMLRTRLMRPMRPADTNDATSADAGITVEFDASIQTLGALEAAAYRLIASATCQIERSSDRFVCQLTPKTSHGHKDSLSRSVLRERFLDLVTDENIRMRLAEKTEGVRNVILALAFGSLASSEHQ